MLDLPRNGKSSLRPEHNLLDADEPLYAHAAGSYSFVENENAFLGYSTVPIMKEFGFGRNNTSAALWMAQFAFNNYNNTAASYRSFKDLWNATPTSSIDLVVAKTSDTTMGQCISNSGNHGYVSWNGATDITAYAIYGRSNADDVLRDTGITFAKKGFETAFPIPEELYRIQVAALVGGDEVGKSQVVEI